jgi:hypothetical protein
MNWFIDKLHEIRKKEMDTVVQQAEAPAAPAKPKKPRKPKANKPKIPPKAEPKVDVLKFDFDPENPRLGSIELDWNTEFVELLTKHGYFGNTEEEVVDKWLNDVCRTIIANQYPGAVASASALAGAKITTRKDLGEGKTEVS